MGWFRVVKDSMTLKIAPFDTAHKSSYWRFIVKCPYLALFLRYSEILVENSRSEPTPPPFGAPRRSWFRGILPRSLALEN